MQIAHQALAADKHLISKHIPGADRKLAIFDQTLDAWTQARTYFQRVFNQGRLAIEHKFIESTAFEQMQNIFNYTNELCAISAETPVPFAVPVGVQIKIEGGGQLEIYPFNMRAK